MKKRQPRGSVYGSTSDTNEFKETPGNGDLSLVVPLAEYLNGIKSRLKKTELKDVQERICLWLYLVVKT